MEEEMKNFYESSEQSNSDKSLGNLKSIGDFSFDDVVFDEKPVPFELLGQIKPIKMKWMVGGKEVTSSNYIQVPTHHHEFCIEEVGSCESTKSERYFVKFHRDDYFFEPFYNPRDKSNHDLIGLCSQDFYDCVGLLSRLTFDGKNGKRYCLMGTAHTFSGLESPFLYRLEKLFPTESKLLGEYWEELTGSMNKDKKLEEGEAEEESENEGESEDEEEEKKNQVLEEKKRKMMLCYKYFQIDSFSVFGFLLEMRIIQRKFLEYLENGKTFVIGNGFGIEVDYQFLSSLDFRDDLEFGLIQGNKESDDFRRYIGFKSIISMLGELPNGRDFIDYGYDVFERAYIRLDHNSCYRQEKATTKKEGNTVPSACSAEITPLSICSGNCHNSDVLIDKHSVIAVHYKCGSRKREEKRYRRKESAVYPFVMGSEQFLVDMVATEIEYLRMEMQLDMENAKNEKEGEVEALRKEMEEGMKRIRKETEENIERVRKVNDWRRRTEVSRWKLVSFGLSISVLFLLLIRFFRI